MLTTPAHMEIHGLVYRQIAHKLTGNYRLQRHAERYTLTRAQMAQPDKCTLTQNPHSEVRHTPNTYIVDTKTQNTSQIHRHTCYLHDQAQRVVYKHTRTGHQQRPIETQTKTGRHT